MRSSCHNFSKILSNRNEISQTCTRVNVVVPNTFLGSFGSGVSELEDLKGKKYFEIFPHAFSGSFKHRDFHEDIIISTESERLGRISTRNSLLGAHCQGVADK